MIFRPQSLSTSSQQIQVFWQLSDLAMSYANKHLGNSRSQSIQMPSPAAALCVGDIFVLRLSQQALELRVVKRAWDLMQVPPALTYHLALQQEAASQALPG